MQLPPPDAILSSVCKAFEECFPIKRFQNKHNTKHIQNKVLTHNLKAFTLAEVLIALVVIGIVAAITVPTLIQRYQDQALKSALKKNYSVLKSALDKYQVENGERLLSGDIGYHQLKPILMKYLNVIKDCGWNNCYYTNNSSLYKSYFGQNTINVNLFDEGQFILNDGAFVMIENFGATDDDKPRIYISVDVNGIDKKPNRLGKDLFMFQLMENGELLPMGSKNTRYYHNADWYCRNAITDIMNGAGCTAKVLRD